MIDNQFFSGGGFYNGTAGSVNRPASIERESKKELSERLAKVMCAIREAGEDGMTWQEVARELELHHGQASAALSNLHSLGHVFTLRRLRNKCHPYVDRAYRHSFFDDEVYDEPARTKASLEKEAVKELVEAVEACLYMASAFTDLNPWEKVLQEALNKYRKVTK
jgi:hypothetical protein